jgi:hypothetical protein
MRSKLLTGAVAAAAIAAAAAPALGQAQRPVPQRSPAASAPTPRLVPAPTAEERARLVATVTRGRLLFELARAAQLTTQDLLTRVPDPTAAGVTGWVATPDGNTTTVTYYADGADGPVAVYRGQVTGGRVAARDVFTGADRPPLTPTQRRMAAARRAVEGLDARPCSGDFNVFVIPPASEAAPVEVYKISPQPGRGRYPLGGHYLATVAPDGSIASTRSFTNRCLDVDAGAPATQLAGAPAPQPIAVTHLLDPLPTEIHVFLSLWMNRPLLVATGNPERLWTVARGRIGLVGAAQTPPPGPGR